MNQTKATELGQVALDAYRRCYGTRERDFILDDEGTVCDLTDGSGGLVVEGETMEIAECICAALNFMSEMAREERVRVRHEPEVKPLTLEQRLRKVFG